MSSQRKRLVSRRTKSHRRFSSDVQDQTDFSRRLSTDNNVKKQSLVSVAIQLLAKKNRLVIEEGEGQAQDFLDPVFLFSNNWWNGKLRPYWDYVSISIFIYHLIFIPVRLALYDK